MQLFQSVLTIFDFLINIILLTDLWEFLSPSSIATLLPGGFVVLGVIASEWWFVAICLLVSSFLFFVSSRIFLFNRSSVVNQDVEKKFITERVRGKIAREMNDNLGSELFGLKMMSQIALSKSSVSDKDKYLQKIVETSHHLIENISEVIWISDCEQDTFSSLWHYLQKNALHYLKPSCIKYAFDTGCISMDELISGERRHNILQFHRYFFQQLTLWDRGENTELFFTIQSGKLVIIIGEFRCDIFSRDIGQQLLKLQGQIVQQKGNRTIIEIPLAC